MSFDISALIKALDGLAEDAGKKDVEKLSEHDGDEGKGDSKDPKKGVLIISKTSHISPKKAMNDPDTDEDNDSSKSYGDDDEDWQNFVRSMGKK